MGTFGPWSCSEQRQVDSNHLLLAAEHCGRFAGRRDALTPDRRSYDHPIAPPVAANFSCRYGRLSFPVYFAEAQTTVSPGESPFYQQTHARALRLPPATMLCPDSSCFHMGAVTELSLKR